MGSNIEAYNVVCLKWGTKYPPEYVNRLFNMVNRNTTIEYKFYCITDNAEGLDEDIEVKMISDLSLVGWWYKLMIFKEDFYGISGTSIFLDLDVVITSNIDNLFTLDPGEFKIIKDLKEGFNSSVFRLTMGSLPHIWNDFVSNKEEIVNRLHGDQDWIAESAPEQMNAWPEEWIVSYKKQCSARAERTYGRVGQWARKHGLISPPYGKALLPLDAKIVIFHGKPDPEDVQHGPWDMWKHAPWINENWY